MSPCLVALLVAACTPGAAPPPAAPAPALGSTATPPDASELRPAAPPQASCPASLALSAAPRRPSGRSPQLVDHAGDLRGPLPWVAAEAVDASPESPLLVLLHGRGDSPERFLQLGHDLAARLDRPLRVIAVRGPQPLGVSGGRQWFGRAAPPGETPEAPEKALAARVGELSVLLGRLAERYPAAPPPVIIGFSQGAMVALHFAAALGAGTTSAKVAGVVALSGAFAAEVAAASPTGEGAQVRPPVLVVAGTRDAIVPPEGAWRAAGWFAQRGHAVACHAFDGTHRVTPEVLDAVAGWLHALLQP